MFSLKCLTKKFNKQSLSEVRPAPPSETVDNTYPPPPKPAPAAIPSNNTITTLTATSPTSADHTPHTFPPPAPISDSAHPLTDNEDDQPNQVFHAFITDPSGITDSTCTSNPPDTCMYQLPSSPSVSVASFSSSPPPSSSDSEDTEDESPPFSRAKGSPFSRSKAHSHPRKNLHSELKIERISSAEKRKYSQYKCSTGGSSPSSSDDEIKEAFEWTASRHRNLHTLPGQHHAWAWGHPSTTNFTSPSFSPSAGASEQPVSGWNVDPFEAAGRPLKVVPVGRHKHKFFAQMSSNFSDRPFLDFNKMQHSKRLVMVRRPMVIRNNSRVHSIQRSSPSNLQVSLDISQHSFQPVLTQT